MVDFAQANAAWAQQQATAAAAQQEALKTTGKTFDTGFNMDLFDFSAEGTYQIRIWPRFEEPAQFWFPAHLYTFHPVPTLPRGFSPKTFQQTDILDNWLGTHFPYDKDSDIAKDWRGRGPGYRILMLVQVRGMLNQQWQLVPMQNVDPNKLYIWSCPYFKNGFKHAIEPELQKTWAQFQGVNPVDLSSGFDATFSVTGKGRDRTISAFQFLTQNPGPANDPAMTSWIFEQSYKPLPDVAKVLTDEDLQILIDYFEPIAKVSKLYPDSHQSPRNAASRGICTNFLEGLEGQAVNAPGAPTGGGAQSFQPPTPPQPQPTPLGAPGSTVINAAPPVAGGPNAVGGPPGLSGPPVTHPQGMIPQPPPPVAGTPPTAQPIPQPIPQQIPQQIPQPMAQPMSGGPPGMNGIPVQPPMVQQIPGAPPVSGGPPMGATGVAPPFRPTP